MDRESERRSDPRRGIAARVGLAVAATGLMSAAVDRRALAGTVPDLPMAAGFGLALALLVLAALRRPPRAAVWVALAALAAVHLHASLELSGGPAVALLFVAMAVAATLATAEHLRPLMAGAFALWTPVLWLHRQASFDTLTPELKIASILALVYTAYAIADPRRVHPSDRLRSAGFGVLAIAIASATAARTLSVTAAAPLSEGIALVVVVVLVSVGALHRASRVREIVGLGAGLVAFFLLGVAYLLAVPYHADAVVAPHHAAELLLAGRQPYAEFDLTEAVARFDLDPALATHLEDGSVLRTFAYPALSFLAVTPFVWLGYGDIRWIYLGVVLLFALVAARQVRPAWRPFAVATVIGSEVIVRQNILAGIDPLWALLLLGAWLVRRRRWPFALLLGLAIADRQPAWFAAPFLIVAVAQAAGRREALARAALALLVAVAVNAPFVAAAPGRAVGGILAPMVAPIQADGVGLMQVGVTDRYTTLLPHAAYTVLAAAVFLVLLWLVARRPSAFASAPLVFPFVPLWFAWRSLQNYFAFAAPFALVADDEIADTAPPPGGPRTPTRPASAPPARRT